MEPRINRQHLLDRQYLFSVLSYDRETGAFAWICNPHCRGGSRRTDKVAGTKTRAGYTLIGLNKVHFLAHRLAWFYVTGEWPKHEIDHKNGIRDDNRWGNLRAATVKQQRENAIPQRRSASGVRGVYWFKRTQQWRAAINHNSKPMSLGYHDTLIDAVAARKAAERRLFTHHREQV